MPNPGLVGVTDPSDLNPKPCAKCGEQKRYKEFYFKKDRNDYDKTCGECRKLERRKRDTMPTEESDDALMVSSIDEIGGGALDGNTEMASAEIEQDEFDRAVRVFQLLKKWHDEALAQGPIKGWKSL